MSSVATPLDAAVQSPSGAALGAVLDALRRGGLGREELLREAVRRIHASNPLFHWTGIYELRGDSLVLGPFLGPPTEHTRIPVGRGVCGTAVAESRNMNVPDVTAVPNYLACSLDTRSELVVLIRRGDRIFGQIDIDSHAQAAFGSEDLARVEEVASFLAGLYDPAGEAGHERRGPATPPRIAVVIPAVDEEESVGLVLAEIPPLASEVIVVDNGSRDRTAEVAREGGARVVHEPRRGYGQACLAGIAAAPDADIFVFLDADHSDYPEQMADVLAPILSGEADLVIGSRALGRRAPGAHPWHAVFGTRMCVALMNRLIGTKATDLGPFRAIRAEALRLLDMRDRSFGWTVEMQVKAALRGLRVEEVRADYRPRIGRSKVSGTVSGTLRAAVGILGTIARHALSRAG